MILADTSVWIEYIRFGEPIFATLLAEERVAVHPFVIGELAVGSLKNRAQFIDKLRDMPQIVVAMDDEVLALVEQRRIFGLGIGYVDAHLLAALQLTPGARLWTRDRRLHSVAETLGVAFQTAHH